ncbi:hypothetical protein AB0L59_37380 [Streptomyces sp. NPDC052109]|uniref:hypothetical protein n=1 Tax=Streptomyces sp. NPDC052109 TaxID=3155527 RepID=UPI00341C7574
MATGAPLLAAPAAASARIRHLLLDGQRADRDRRPEGIMIDAAKGVTVDSVTVHGTRRVRGSRH